MPRKANDTTAAPAAPEAVVAAPVQETAHHPYCLCGTHGSYKMIAGLLIGLFLLAAAFASGVFAGKITDRFGRGDKGRGGMMGGYSQSYGGSGSGRGMMRGYHGYGYKNGTTTVPNTQDDSNPSTAVPTTPAQ